MAFDPSRKIGASDGRRGDDFGAEKDAGYSPSGDRVLDFDADRTDSAPALDLFARRIGNSKQHHRIPTAATSRLPAEGLVLSEVVDWRISGDSNRTGGCC
jgi:hypothetical protein